jgi:hypothetical protein
MSETFPAEDRRVVIDFGNDGPFGPFAAELTFSGVDGTVAFLVTRGALLDKAETCGYSATKVADDIWLVTWREADGLTVVQVQDFAQGTVTSAVTTPDHQLLQLDGAISFV